MKFYVLAGGRSTRMRQNKAVLKIRGTPMIEHVLKAIPAPKDEIAVITNTPQTYKFLAFRKLGDIYPGLGPISGIHAGLADSDQEVNFFLACDLPNLRPKIIAHLLSAYREQDVLGPQTSGGNEPLCTIYTRRCLPVIEKQIKQGNYSLQSLFQKVKSEFIEIEDDSILTNINTPDDFSQL